MRSAEEKTSAKEFGGLYDPQFLNAATASPRHISSDAKIMPTKTTKKKTAPVADVKKPAVKKTAAAKAAAPKKAASYTQDDVALRAYFIAEKRRKLGLPGDPHSDWVEAERQLAAESRPKTKARPKKA